MNAIIGEVEHNIPIPTVQRGKNTSSKYPFKTMAIGDSFLVKCAPEDRLKVAKRLTSAGNVLKELEVSTRLVSNGVRCWRVK